MVSRGLITIAVLLPLLATVAAIESVSHLQNQFVANTLFSPTKPDPAIGHHGEPADPSDEESTDGENSATPAPAPAPARSITTPCADLSSTAAVESR